MANLLRRLSSNPFGLVCRALCLLFVFSPFPAPAQQDPSGGKAAGTETTSPGPEIPARELHKQQTGWERWESVAARSLPRKSLSTRVPARWLIRVFQRYVSPVDGPSCTFHPSCSAYGMEAINRHGVLLGVPMASERIIRNHHPDNPERYPLYESKERHFYLDPVQANDSWWADTP